MYALALLLFAVSAVTGSPYSGIIGDNDTNEGSLNSRIIGGNDSPIGKYPYQVVIKNYNFPSCGGSIINSRYILTAAHCIYHKNLNSIKIVAGTNYLNKGGITYAAEALIWPSNYDESTYLNDIGLIRVKGNIDFTDKIQPVVLAFSYYVPPGETAVVTGWGRINTDITQAPILLQEIFVTVISQSQCESLYWKLTKNNICTYTKRNEGACYGDSGGPLVLNGIQIGIVSYGSPCAIGYPDVYTRVYPYRRWIRSIIISDINAGNHVRMNWWIVLLIVTWTLVSHSCSLS